MDWGTNRIKSLIYEELKYLPANPAFLMRELPKKNFKKSVPQFVNR